MSIRLYRRTGSTRPGGVVSAVGGAVLIGAMALVGLSASGAWAAPGPAPTPVVAAGGSVCVAAQQLTERGLLARAEELYRKPLADGAPPPALAGCVRDGLAGLAKLRRDAATAAAKGDRARTAGDRNAAQEQYRDALRIDADNEAATAGLRALDSKPGDAVQNSALRITSYYDDYKSAFLLFLAGLVLLYLLIRLAPLIPGPAENRVGRQARAIRIGTTVAAWLVALVALVQAGRTQRWVLLGVAAVAILVGCLLLGWCWRVRLRLHLDVQDHAGQRDPSGSAYLATQLRALGRDRPSGLEVPEKTDVMALPEGALSILPAGNVLAALLRFVNGLRPTTPWSVTVTLIDDDRATVAITRNGRSIDKIMVDRSSLLPRSGGDGSEPVSGGTKTQLLTGAAAAILFRLGAVHRDLREGLAGATTWESVAAVVLATDPAIAPQDNLCASLLANAVDRDPANFSARLAYLVVTSRRADDLAGHQAFAAETDRLYRDLPLDGRGWQALRLRVLFNRAIGWFNVYLFRYTDGHGDPVGWLRAMSATRELVTEIDSLSAADESDLQVLLAELRPPVSMLWQSVVDTAPTSAAGPDTVLWRRLDAMTRLVKPWTTGARLTRQLHYNWACLYAGRGDLLSALAELEPAVADGGLRSWARRDPSLRPLYDNARFKWLVGDPPPEDFAALTPLRPYAGKLRAIGIRTAVDLLKLTTTGPQRAGVARDVEVPPLVVARWRRIAQLGELDPTLTVEQLALLLAVEVDSVDALRARTADGATTRALRAALVEAAVDVATLPPDDYLVSVWARLAAASAAPAATEPEQDAAETVTKPATKPATKPTGPKKTASAESAPADAAAEPASRSRATA